MVLRNVPKQPARMREALPCEACAGPQRRRETGADVVLPVGRDGCIERHDQGPVTGRLHALDQRDDLRLRARQVGLEPGLRVRLHDLLQPDERRAAHDHRHVLARGGTAPGRGRRGKPTARRFPSARCRTARTRSCRTAWSRSSASRCPPGRASRTRSARTRAAFARSEWLRSTPPETYANTGAGRCRRAAASKSSRQRIWPSLAGRAIASVGHPRLTCRSRAWPATAA